MRLSLGKASPWKIHPDTTAEKMEVDKGITCMSKKPGVQLIITKWWWSSTVGFDDYGMPIPSLRLLSSWQDLWRQWRKSSRTTSSTCLAHAKQKCRFVPIAIMLSFEWCPKVESPLEEIPDTILIALMITINLTMIINATTTNQTRWLHKSLLIPVETITTLYILHCSSQAVSSKHKITSWRIAPFLWLHWCSFYQWMAPYAHFPSWMVYWRSTISIVHHKFWQDSVSGRVFAQIADMTVGAFQPLICLQYSNRSA